MRLTPIPPADIDILACMGAVDTAPRSPGLHISEIIRSLKHDLGLQRQAPWDMGTTAQVGFLWESIFEASMAKLWHADHYYHPGEQVAAMGDGPVYGTPDLIYAPDYRLTELKARWRSSHTWDTLEAEYPDVLWQVKAYCHMLQTNLARMVFLFVVGDWKGSGPTVRGCDLEFDSREIEANWAMLSRHAQSKQLKGYTNAAATAR